LQLLFDTVFQVSFLISTNRKHKNERQLLVRLPVDCVVPPPRLISNDSFWPNGQFVTSMYICVKEI
jgi:hypothetical protein